VPARPKFIRPDGGTSTVNWRNPLGTMRDFSPNQTLQAVAYSSIKLGSAVQALGVTMLPTSQFGQILPFLFVRPGQTVTLHCNHSETTVVQASVGQNVVRFQPAVPVTALTWVNQLRSFVSSVFNSIGSLPDTTTRNEALSRLFQLVTVEQPSSEEHAKLLNETRPVEYTCDESTDYLPKLSMTSQLTVGLTCVWVLCRKATIANRPVGWWTRGREECSGGESAWHEVLFRHDESNGEDMLELLLLSFASLVRGAPEAVMDLGQIEDEQATDLLRRLCKRIGLIRFSVGLRTGEQWFVALTHEVKRDIEFRMAVRHELEKVDQEQVDVVAKAKQ